MIVCPGLQWVKVKKRFYLVIRSISFVLPTWSPWSPICSFSLPVLLQLLVSSQLFPFQHFISCHWVLFSSPSHPFCSASSCFCCARASIFFLPLVCCFRFCICCYCCFFVAPCLSFIPSFSPMLLVFVSLCSFTLPHLSTSVRYILPLLPPLRSSSFSSSLDRSGEQRREQSHVSLPISILLSSFGAPGEEKTKKIVWEAKERDKTLIRRDDPNGKRTTQDIDSRSLVRKKRTKTTERKMKT